MNEKYKLYGYRWVVLTVFMLINLTMDPLRLSTVWVTCKSACSRCPL